MKKNQEITMQYTNVEVSPPSAKEAEKAVLGACLVEIDAIEKVIDRLTPDSFYYPIHKVIYSKIVELYNSSVPIDLITVYEGLKTDETFITQGNIAYLTSLTSHVASAFYIQKHALIIKEKEIRRNVIYNCYELINNAYDESYDIENLIKDFSLKSDEISGRITANDVSTIGEVVANSLTRFHENQDLIKQGGLTGITTGSFALDKKLGRYQPGNLIIVAARPGMGKTAFALNTVTAAAMEGTNCAFVSLEMKPEELVNRMFLRETDKFRSDILKNTEAYDEEIMELNRVAGTIEKLPVTFIKNRSINITSLKSKCRKLRKKGKLDLLVIDYLQLMNEDKKNNREQEIAFISRELKMLAQELEIPIITLSQLNRSLEARADKRPLLSDLRESGAIEQDADIVILLNRPIKYGLKELENDEGKIISSEGIIVCDIAKQRNGEVGDILLRHNKTVTKIWDYSINV